MSLIVKLALAAVMFSGVSKSVTGQEAPLVERKAMKKLSFMFGRRIGKSVDYDRAGKIKHMYGHPVIYDFVQHISFSGQNQLLDIDTVWSYDGGDTINKMSGVINYDLKAGGYRFTSSIRNNGTGYFCVLELPELNCVADLPKSRMTFRFAEQDSYRFLMENVVDGEWQKVFEAFEMPTQLNDNLAK